MISSEVIINLKQRMWQRPLIAHYRSRRASGKPAHASVVAHRRAGKDRAALFIELEEMLISPREVWHCLPEYAQARKVVWDALTKEGERLIDVSFPKAIRSHTDEHEMKIRLKNGSLWRLVGADNFNSLVGSNPRFVTFSEFALTMPKAREFVRPILAENGGSDLMITTPRGYNHAYALHEYASKEAKKKGNAWYSGFHPVSQTKLIPADVLAEERRQMPDELYRQEYECDWSAANVGSILGSRVEAAEKEGRISERIKYDDDQPVILSSDIGFRDAAAFWFWQPRPGGYASIDYMEDSGLDADDWVERLQALPYEYGTVWLPHDAKSKTFATKRSAMERFMAAGFKVRVVPRLSDADRINAARMVVERCHFAKTKCALGLARLRNWSFKWDDARRVFSKEPLHDENSHGGDGYSYGAVVMRESLPPPAAASKLPAAAMQAFTLDDLHGDRERDMDEERIG